MVKEKHITLIHLTKQILYNSISLGATTSISLMNSRDQVPQAVADVVVAVWQVNGFVAACELQHNFLNICTYVMGLGLYDEGNNNFECIT